MSVKIIEVALLCLPRKANGVTEVVQSQILIAVKTNIMEDAVETAEIDTKLTVKVIVTKNTKAVTDTEIAKAQIEVGATQVMQRGIAITNITGVREILVTILSISNKNLAKITITTVTTHVIDAGDRDPLLCQILYHLILFSLEIRSTKADTTKVGNLTRADKTKLGGLQPIQVNAIIKITKPLFNPNARRTTVSMTIQIRICSLIATKMATLTRRHNLPGKKKKETT